MKKIFKGLAVLAATAAVGAGVAFAAGCGSNGVYEGSYSYENYSQTYGMSVKVTVKNNIITKVEDTTAELHADWHSVSSGWEDYYTGDTKHAIYEIVTKATADVVASDVYEASNYRPGAFTFRIDVASSGTINSFKIVKNGSTADRYTDMMPETFLDGKWFVGKTADDILKAFDGSVDYDADNGNIHTGLFSNDLATGASQSDFACLQAAVFASKNAAAVIGGKKLDELTDYVDVIDIAKCSVSVKDGEIPAAPGYYKWTNDQAANWTTNKAWLLQQYEGWTVADVLNIKVFVKDSGEPYVVKDDDNIVRNGALSESGLLITGATQGSGRLLLAIQDALSK